MEYKISWLFRSLLKGLEINKKYDIKAGINFWLFLFDINKLFLHKNYYKYLIP